MKLYQWGSLAASSGWGKEIGREDNQPGKKERGRDLKIRCAKEKKVHTKDVASGHRKETLGKKREVADWGEAIGKKVSQTG